MGEMTLGRKTSRTIGVEGVVYRWSVSPDDACLWLILEETDVAGQRVEARFCYGDVVDIAGSGVRQGRSILPGMVRRVVERALRAGWRPRERGLRPLRIEGEVFRG